MPITAPYANRNKASSKSPVKMALTSLHGVVMQSKTREEAIRAVPTVADAYGLTYGTKAREEYAEVAGHIVNRYKPA